MLARGLRVKRIKNKDGAGLQATFVQSITPHELEKLLESSSVACFTNGYEVRIFAQGFTVMGSENMSIENLQSAIVDFFDFTLPEAPTW